LNSEFTQKFLGHLYGLYFSSVSKGLGFSIIHDARLDPSLLYSYGKVQPQRQAEIIKQLNSPHEKDDLNADAIVEAVFRRMKAGM
jgi:hypothetical protein